MQGILLFCLMFIFAYPYIAKIPRIYLKTRGIFLCAGGRAQHEDGLSNGGVRSTLVRSTVLRGRDSQLLFEYPGKVLHVHNAAMQGNRLDLQFGCVEQIGRVFHAPPTDVFGYRLTGFFFENGGKITEADALTGGKDTCRQIGRQISVDDQDCLLHGEGVFLQAVLADQTAV